MRAIGNRTLWTVTALALCAGLLAVSCSKEEPKLTGEPIKIGCLFALSGPAGHIGTPSKYVAEMVRDKINAEGGIGGRPIELVMADTESSPDKALVGLRRLVDKDQVVAIVGPTRTGTIMACLGAIDELKVPVVACVGGSPPVTPARPWVFKSPQKTTTAVERIYTHLKKKGVTKVALATASDGFGKEGKASLEALAPNHGIEIVAAEEFGAADVDMTVQMTKLAGTDAGAVIVWTIGPAGATVAKNAKQIGLAVPLVQCHGLPDPVYIELAGEAAEGTIMPSTKLVVAEQIDDADPQKALLVEFKNEYENVRGHGPVSTHSGYAWDAIQIVAKAVEVAGTDAEALRDAIEGTTGYVGVSGVYNMTAEDHCGLDVDSLVMVTVKDGKWVLLE